MGLVLAIALIIDLALGEPKVSWHPVAFIGKIMALFDKRLRSAAKSPVVKRLNGLLLTLIFTVGAYFVGKTAVNIAFGAASWLGWIIEAALIWMSISLGELLRVNRRIAALLDAGRLCEARLAMSALVGRDTLDLNETQIRTASLESLSENLVDACIAPLFYTLIGGGPLALTYRVVNTMDSMFGYKNDTYIDFGWAAAKLDDAASWIPARLVVIFLSFANGLFGRGFWVCLKTALTDGRKHASPNSGMPMAVMAGALGVRLGGKREYRGQTKFYGYFGSDIQAISTATFKTAAALAVITTLLMTTFGLTTAVYFRGLSWLIG